MTYLWTRQTPFLNPGEAKEQWCLEKAGRLYEFDVKVRFGKRIDFLSIKKDWPYQRETEIAKQKQAFFSQKGEFASVDRCPVCSNARSNAHHKIRVCGVDYLQCDICTHVYSTIFPTLRAVESFYREPPFKNDYYLNPNEVDLRLREIYTPKLEWIVEAYRNTYNSEPANILDIGAGAGHFLHACKKMGLSVAGIEYSPDYGQWCKKNFDIKLSRSKEELGDRRFDIVTSFNVIEHSYSPNDFIMDYRSFMHEKSLAVIETPKVNSFTAHLQSIFPDEPRGIIIPYEHNHLFTDASLATLLFENGLAVKNVWYFGQDISELILRLCTELGVEGTGILGQVSQGLQEALDCVHGSNLMIFAAVFQPCTNANRGNK